MKITSGRGITIVACLLGLVGLGGGCAPSDRDAGRADAIRLGLNWIPDAQHAGFYAAETFGLFDQAGLSVRILPGGPGTPVVQNVATKQLDFAVANADQVLMARAQGAPVVAVLASMQTSPRCIMVHAERDIQSLDDLHDVTLALGPGKAFAKFLKRELPMRNVKVIPYTGSIALFLRDPNFCQQAYVFSEPYVVRREGGDPVTLMVSELGFDPYTSCLVTHEDLIQADPERVHRVVHCIRRGWLEYFRNPQPVHDRILAENSTTDAASLQFGMQALRPLVIPNSLDESFVGSMDPERWQVLCDQLIALDLLPAETDPTSAYTTQFTEAMK